MPKLAMNYENAVIYKIVCNDLAITDCYVGSTTNFTKRKNYHKNDCRTRNYKVYQTIRANGDWINWSMILVEVFPTTSNILLEQRERYWIEILGATLNSQLPSRTKEELKIRASKQCKQYRLNNKDKINEIVQCDCGIIIINANLNRHQQTNKHINAMELKSNL